jgi:hypothetical protein
MGALLHQLLWSENSANQKYIEGFRKLNQYHYLCSNEKATEINCSQAKGSEAG